MGEREEKRREGKGEEEVSPLCVDSRRRTCSPATGRPFKGPFHRPPPSRSLPVLYSSSALVSTEQMKCFLIRDIPC